MTSRFPVEPAHVDERAEAFRLIFQHLPERERGERVSNALVLVHRRELDPDGVLVVRDRAGIVGALVCTPAPGAGGLVWPPQIIAAASDRSAIEDALVDRACTWLRQGGARLAQTMLVTEEAPMAAPLLRHGFAHVTALWYMRHHLDLPATLFTARERLTFVPYPRDPPRFHDTLLRTYDGTEDCPEVSGVRTIDEIIDGHKAQGVHDPQRWWLALHGDRPAGVLILTAMPEWDGWDVSYIGIVPEARRHGFGREVMRHALVEARTAEARQLTLSVDARNRPAWQLYQALGFEAFEQREVFLAIWNAASRET